jgi:hypothetical protein
MGQTGADGTGAGVYCESTCTLNNVTISGNSIGITATGLASTGGGLHVAGGATRLRNVTVTSNLATGTGGGIAVGGGSIATRNSLFAGNTGATSQHDCSIFGSGAVTSEGYNLIRINNDCAAVFVVNDQAGTAASPLEPVNLGDLSPNGGPTDTHELEAGSLAIDGGNPAGCLAWNGTADVAMPFDQRGEARSTDGDGDTVATCDVGAYEAEAAPPIENTLTVTLAGASGGGSVASDPAGIACPPDCSENYVFTATVELTATPAADHAFTGWSGDCSGTGACEVAMSDERTVIATFAVLRDLVLTFAGGGGGTVTSSPAGVNCTGACTTAFVDGVQVTLTATPAAGSVFTGWSGDCVGASCAVQMSADRAVTATFQLLRTLALTLGGAGSGTVTSTPAGISCPGTCSAGFADGLEVTLDAAPGAGSTFGGFSGDCAGGACVLQMTADRGVTATFDLAAAIFEDDFENGGYCEWSEVSGAPPCAP